MNSRIAGSKASMDETVKSKRHSGSILRLLYGVIAGLLIGISALAIVLVQDQLRETETIETGHFSVEGETEYDGAIGIEPPVAVPDFTLTDQHGEPFNLRELRGRLVLLTFGFTNCPDVCPLTLSDLQQVKTLLGADAEQVKLVFVSVDGNRDTPEVLRDYLAFRKLDDIVALTGGEDEVRNAGAPFGLAFEVSGNASAPSYSINHTAGSFLLDRRGSWIMRFQFGLPPERIAAKLRKLLP